MTLITKTPARTIEQDMIDSERELFHSPFSDWGDARAAAERGAVYLDRVMPGWAERVEINDLDLSSSCSCVLGQLFHTEARDLRGQWFDADQPTIIMAGNGPLEDPYNYTSDGFGFAIQLLGLKKAESRVAHDGVRVHLNAAYFFGFDHTEQYGYGDLTEVWTELIAERQPVNA